MDPAASPGYAPHTSEGFLAVLKRFSPLIFAVIVVCNLLLINGLVFFRQQPKPGQLTTKAPELPKAPLTGIPVSPQNADITAQINQATESVRLQILSVLSTTPQPSQTPTPSPAPSQSTSQITHDYFVPLGTGFGNGTDWTTITQLGATVNSANYGSIKSVVFEAAVRIPTGNQTVYVRLLNADTYQTVAGSELTLSGGTPTILTSSTISLASGSHLYQVQLKTQLGYTTYIDLARLKITSNN
ncbi:MAG: hypothetical protein Q8Q49_06300 [bacterium]|nr:hypothetical protein [bacterium]